MNAIYQPRFQHRQCNGEKLLDLTESDLINDYGIKNRLHRERILSAIDAIKTSDDFSDEEEEEEDDEEEEEEENSNHVVSSHHMQLQRAAHDNEGLRRNSLPSQTNLSRGIPGSNVPGNNLPSSNAMVG